MQQLQLGYFNDPELNQSQSSDTHNRKYLMSQNKVKASQAN